MALYCEKLISKDGYPFWILFETGRFRAPLCVLGEADVRHFLRDLCNSDLELVKRMAGETCRDVPDEPQ